MSQISDSIETALVESSKVLAGYGQVIPVTMANLKLKAQFLDGTVVEGASNIRTYRGEIDKISIDPIDALAHPSAIQAIEGADLIVVGPGSLYTSILPKLLVPKIIEANNRMSASTVYACNVATELGETEGFTIADHMAHSANIPLEISLITCSLITFLWNSAPTS